MSARFPFRRSTARSARTYLARALCCACVSACARAEQATQPGSVTSPAPGMSQPVSSEPNPPVPSNLPTSVGAQAGSSAGLTVVPPAAVGGSTGLLAAAGVPAAGSGGISSLGAHAGQSSTPPTPTLTLTLTPTDAMPVADGFFVFPASALPPMNQSPGYRWTGVPAQAKSLALVFRDVSSATPPVKWILWDIPASVTQVPANLGNSAHPMQVPGSSQLGSLGNQGYAGPCCEDHEYEWILYALDVDTLSGTERLSTAQIRTDLLLHHDVAQSKPVLMRIKP